MVLCGFFLTLVLINGAIKYFTSTYRYRVGDRLLRLLRYTLIERVMRFPVPELRNTSSGPIVSMVTSETSTLGYFMAEAFAVPAVAAGTLITITLFMFMQDWTMGIAAVALYPAQIYLIPKLQKQINALQRDEVVALRRVSQRIGEVVAGAQEIHGHDATRQELADFSHRLAGIFRLRVQMSSKRYMANVLNAFFSQLTPFFFLSIGGYLVIRGHISLGSLVAVLAAYKDMYAPWKDLIDYYQKAEDARVKYDQIRRYFDPAGLLDPMLLLAPSEPISWSGSNLSATNVTIETEEGVKSVDGASLTLQLPTHAAIIGGDGSGREDFARLLARQLFPRSGRLAIGDRSVETLPDSVTGRRIGYVGSDVYLAAGAIRSALLYPLYRRSAADEADQDQKPAALPAIDYDAAGCRGPEDLSDRVMEVLRLVDLDSDLYEIGLRRSIDPTRNPGLADRLIAARKVFVERLRAKRFTALVDSFDPESYNVNASVAENILFGTPVGPKLAIDNLGENPYMLRTIAAAHLTETFLDIGSKLAAIMGDIFRDLAPGHDFFERFSFIRAEDLPVFDDILRKIDAVGPEGLDETERTRLMALPFKLVVAQHHVGLIDSGMQQQLLAARYAFAANLPDDLLGSVQFFDSQNYNADGSIADNILFGKIASGKAGSAAQIGNLMAEVVAELGLRRAIVETGLEYDVGVAGVRLSAAQRQKVALARCLLKRPELLILDEALSSLEPTAQTAVLANIRAEMADRSLILLETTPVRTADFDHVLTMENGKIVEAAKSIRRDESAPAGPARGADSDFGLNDAASMLARIPLFASIDRSKLKLLAFTSLRQSYDAGQTIFRQGETGQNAYVVIDGMVEVILETTAGERTVATLGSNQVFGEMALLAEMSRTTTIRAATPVSLLAISSDVFLQLVEENSEIAAGIIRILAERLAATLRNYANAA